jgi:hypothetical protein
MVGRRYYVTAWNRFYPAFFSLIKNKIEEAKIFSPSSYVYRDDLNHKPYSQRYESVALLIRCFVCDEWWVVNMIPSIIINIHRFSCTVPIIFMYSTHYFHVQYPLFSCKIPIIFVGIYWKLNFLDRFSKNTGISNFMKTLRVGAELFHTDGPTQTYRHEAANESLFAILRTILKTCM